MLYSQFPLQEPLGHQNTHLAFALLVIFVQAFLSALKQRKKIAFIWFALALLAIGSTLYIQLSWKQLDFYAGSRHDALQLSVGTILITLIIVATWREVGPVLPTLAILFILYAYVGHYIPGRLGTSPLSFDALVSKLCINMEGVYGILLSVSAVKVYLFMIFAVWMSLMGATDFFSEVGKVVGRYFRAGAAVTAVVTSGMVGSVTGQAAANVSITGSFTIPAMKRSGYTPEQAGAIEAAASSGGPIIPPIMGIAAFIMSAMTGIRYVKIIGVAVIPAALYVLTCFLYVILQGAKMQIAGPSEKINSRELALRAPLFLVPLATIIFLFIKGRTELFVSFWACVTVMILGLIRKETRPSLRGFLIGCVQAAKLGSQVAIVCATLGIVLKVISMSGLGLLLPHIVGDLCGENLDLLLVLTAIVAIALGTGLPAATSYILVAVVIAPIMMRLGVNVLASHFYAFYFCNFSYITPPVALAAVFASRLAEANYIKTAFEATKVGMAGFILPFAFVWNPALLLDFKEDPVLIAIKLAATVLALFSLQVGVVGYLTARLTTAQRILSVFSGVLFLMTIRNGSLTLLLTGLIVMGYLIFWTVARVKSLRSMQRPLDR